MADRLELHHQLTDLLGNPNVYFQPPASIKLEYPCVIYSIGSGDAKRANNCLYNYTHRYEIMFIFKRPTLSIIEEVLNKFQMSRFDRSYVTDNLNHYVFNIYF